LSVVLDGGTDGYYYDGYDAMGRVTASRQVVVMVTGDGEVTEQAKAAGADEVLLKPINPNALVWTVDKQIS
jgi:DNA-binding response OmpR family regulator